MPGRKPQPLVISREDLAILLRVSRQPSLPAYHVQRARIVLGASAGEPIVELAERNYCDPATVWRACRCYERAGDAVGKPSSWAARRESCYGCIPVRPTVGHAAL